MKERNDAILIVRVPKRLKDKLVKEAHKLGINLSEVSRRKLDK